MQLQYKTSYGWVDSDEDVLELFTDEDGDVFVATAEGDTGYRSGLCWRVIVEGVTCGQCGYSLLPANLLTEGERQCICEPHDHSAELGVDHYDY